METGVSPASILTEIKSAVEFVHRQNALT